MKKIFKFIFYAYVISLAGYVTYGLILQKRLTRQKVVIDAPEKKCFDSGDWDYCIFKSPQTRADIVLYVFNAMGEDVSFWQERDGYPALLQKYWQEQNRQIPLVISVSFGKSWLATFPESKKSVASFDRLQNEVFPAIEMKVGTPRSRFLMGQSLGGLNALSTALSMPRYFSRVALLCPPLSKQSPFDGWYKQAKFVLKSGATASSVIQSLTFTRSYFANDIQWKNFSPFHRVGEANFTKNQHFYLSAGLNDKWGFYQGTADFMEELKKTGATIHWRPNSGGHCAVDIQSLGRFLSF